MSTSSERALDSARASGVFCANRQDAPIEENNAAMAIIEANDLTKEFGSNLVLDGVNLQVSPGEVFGYLGPNGAGKTTTVRLMMGLLAPTSGQARIFEQDPMASDTLRARVGVLMENSGLDDRMTAWECLDYHARLYGMTDPAPRIEELLDFAGLWERRGDRVGGFSTGMKRKLGIARAICHEPDLLFLDEPSAGLDPEGQKMIRELLLELSASRHMTVFINSHNLSEVERLCSRIAILNLGTISATGTVQELRAMGGRPMVDITLGEGDDAEAAGRAVQQAGLVEDWQANGSKLRAELDGHAGWEIIELLVKLGFRIEEVDKNSRTLEDVYLNIVGEQVAQ